MKLEMEKYICTRPFKKIEVHANGDVYTCCPHWLPKPLGNLAVISVEEAWNSEAAQEIRGSIHDGSFRFCTKSCPYLAAKTHWVKPLAQVDRPELQAAFAGREERLNFLPRTVKCSHDRTCNLSCPSCRKEVISLNRNSEEMLRIESVQEKIFDKLEQIFHLEISGSGDPFASLAALNFLRRIDPIRHAHLKIGLFTNGLLWTEERWNELSNLHDMNVYTQISIDAATKETYAVNRRGGNFKILLKNLGFIQTLRRQNRLSHFTISMVVQANNFHEMPAFARMGEEFGADEVYFSQLENWGTFSSSEYIERAIHLESHPRHHEFKQVLLESERARPLVALGNLTPRLAWEKSQ
jgi:MoaA/NifB/PqqE/SkfB family radical SAM enzyme